MKAIHSLKDTKKKKEVLSILDDKLVDVCLCVDALAKIEDETITTVEDLRIRCDNPVQVLAGLGVKLVRYSKKSHHKIIISKWQIHQLKLLVKHLRAVEFEQ